MARNLTLPLKEVEVQDMEVEDERIELEDAELDGGEDVSKYGTFSKDMNWSNNVVSIQPVDKTVPSPQLLSHQAVTNTTMTATVSTTQKTTTPPTDRRQLPCFSWNCYVRQEED